MYKTPSNVTAGLTASHCDLVPRATLARLFRAEVQRPQRATGEPRRLGVFCTQPGMAKISSHILRGVKFAWERGSHSRVFGEGGVSFYTGVNLALGVLFACDTSIFS